LSISITLVNRSLLQILALLPIPVIAALVVCTGNRPQNQTPLPKERPSIKSGFNEKSRVRLPAQLTSGFKLQGKPEHYDEKTLFDRIDGAAPVYLRAGFAYSIGAEYKKDGAKEPIIVDVYDMGTTSQALGIYRTESDLSYTFIKVGGEGYLASGSLNFWQGRFYIKLAGYEQGEAMDRSITELAEGLSAVLPAAPEAEKELAPLKFLPIEDRLPHSEGFSRAPLGEVEGLEQAYFVAYNVGTQIFRLFVVAEKDPGQATARLAKVKSYFEKDGAKVQEETEGTFKLLKIGGEPPSTFVLLKESILCGAVDLPTPTLWQAAKTKLIQRLTGTSIP
jgi:hypothetical protein